MVSFYTGFINLNGISPLYATLTAFLAKSSMVWCSFLFLHSLHKIYFKQKDINKIN
jgi:hypothetical protein